MVYGGGEFSIFVFLFSLLALVSVPQGRKREKGRTKKEKGKEAAGMICEGQRVFYFPFSIFVFSLGFRPPGRKREKGRMKNEKALPT
jgi:hypothetical protein